MLSTTTFLLSNTFLLSQFSPPLCRPCFPTTFLLSKTFLLSQFSRPLQPMLSMIQVTRGHLRPYLTSIYQKFSPPLQPMLSTTTFLLSNTFLLSQFSPPLQPMLSTTTFLLSNTFLLSKFFPPSAAHAFNYNIPFIKHMPHKKDVGSQPTFGSISRTSRRHQKILHLPHKKRRWGHKRPLGPGHENFSEASNI